LAPTETIDQLAQVVRRHLPVLEPGAALGADVPLKDLGLTSMRSVDLLIEIEDELGVAFPDAELTEQNFETLGSLSRVVDKLLGSDGG
jgi:acyl carrier protein